MRYRLPLPCPKRRASSRQRWIVVMHFAYRTVIGAGLCAALTFAALDFAAAQRTGASSQSSAPGVKHVLYLSVKSDDPGLESADDAGVPNDHASKQTNKETRKATLRIVVRVSDHSQETSFFGDVPIRIADFDLTKGSSEQPIWQDERCHHERGFPRILVMTVDGESGHGSDKRVIEARRRHIGLPIPQDEILAASALQFSADDRGRFIETRTPTKESRLVVDLKMYMLPCEVQ